MITNEINKCLRDVDAFVGTFPCNQIPQPESRPAYYVVNTARLDPMNKAPIVEGKHWVVLMMKESGTCEYFDSFGVQPNQPDIVEFISRNSSKSLTFTTQMLQHPLSRACGVWCVDYILSRSSGVTKSKYLSSFSTDLAANDKLVVDRVTCRLSTLPRPLKSKLKTLASSE